ncbi:MAG: TldD/PmbA family protein [archaeon]
MIKIEDTLKKAIEYSKSASDYCDIRLNSSFSETVSKTPKEESSSTSTSGGIGIRVLKDGAYGYTSCQKTDLASIKEAIDKASKIAKIQSGKTKNKITYIEQKSITDTKSTRIKIDPADISLVEKYSILKDAFTYANLKEIVFTQGRISSGKTDKIFLNTEGSIIKTRIARTIIAHTSVAKRGARQTMNYDVYAKPQGFETIKELDIERFITNISRKAISFLDAVKPPEGKMDVIMSPQVAGTLIHEVFGHAAEADWVANGRSLLKDKLNKRIGSEMMSIYDDGSMPGGWGTIYYDDEGTPSKNTLLLDKGILVQYMHSKETAARLNMPLTGNGRAQDHTHTVIPRMTNTYLAPGSHNIDEMIKDTKKGIIVDKYTVALEDPAGGSFELKTLGGHIIENGELKKPIERATISSSSFIDTFMNVCAISKRMNKMNVGSCGKGHEDWVAVGNPSPHVKIRDLIVGGN